LFVAVYLLKVEILFSVNKWLLLSDKLLCRWMIMMHQMTLLE